MQVPIRPGMQERIRLVPEDRTDLGRYGEPPVSGDDDYVSMIQELKEANQGDYTDRPGLIEAVRRATS